MIHSKTVTLAGFVLCIACLVATQIALGNWVKPGIAQNTGIVEDIGYTFTSLTALAGFILWKWAKSMNISSHTNTYYFWTKLLQTLVAMIPSAFGCIYFYISIELTN
jgi:hypothetical protein